MGAWFRSCSTVCGPLSQTVVEGPRESEKSKPNVHMHWHTEVWWEKREALNDNEEKDEEKTRRFLLFTLPRQHWNGLTDQNTIPNYYLNPVQHCLVSGYWEKLRSGCIKNQAAKIWKMKVIHQIKMATKKNGSTERFGKCVRGFASYEILSNDRFSFDVIHSRTNRAYFLSYGATERLSGFSLSLSLSRSVFFVASVLIVSRSFVTKRNGSSLFLKEKSNHWSRTNEQQEQLKNRLPLL